MCAGPAELLDDAECFDALANKLLLQGLADGLQDFWIAPEFTGTRGGARIAGRCAPVPWAPESRTNAWQKSPLLSAGESFLRSVSVTARSWGKGCRLRTLVDRESSTSRR
jgi:hypothetical protein